MRRMPPLRLLLAAMFLSVLSLCAWVASPRVAQAHATLDQLWQGKAHFLKVATLDWDGAGNEVAGSFIVEGGTWYVFNRASAHVPTTPDCAHGRFRTVARASRDHGLTWSDPVTVAEPGDSKAGDGCMVLDGSAYYDADAAIWHLLAQCLDTGGKGWALCHYTRRSASPLGRFTADRANPVVRGGQIWSRLCAGTGKACPSTTLDEGTPEIVTKKDGAYLVTFHGFDPVTKQGYRGVARTRDFSTWQISGPDLPGDATLGPRDCASWMMHCVGVGAAISFDYAHYRYMLIETMTKSLQCVPGQEWRFELVRSPKGRWPRSGTGGWQRLPRGTLLTTAHPSPSAACPVQYARLIADVTGIYLIYEDWNRARGTVDRPLLKLVRP